MPGDPTLAPRLAARLSLPVIAGPMFIASTPALVIAQCRAGIVGSIPALNARSTAALDEALDQIEEELAAHDAAHPDRPAAPWALNLVAHRSNDRLEADLAVAVRRRVPILIVSLAAPAAIVEAVHGYGGLVLNDVASNRHARRCAEAGADGLIAVAAGAGGHTGLVSPFALVAEIRAWWAGPLALGGCIATGRAILAAEAMGADFAYIGSPFLASTEANTSAEQKRMIVESDAKDVVVTDCFTGVPATFLKPSLLQHGLDPANLRREEGRAVSVKGGGANAKAWRDIWSAGQGVGAVTRVEPAAAAVERLRREYDEARRALARPAAAAGRAPSTDAPRASP